MLYCTNPNLSSVPASLDAIVSQMKTQKQTFNFYISKIYLFRQILGKQNTRKKPEYQGNFNRQTLAVQSQIHDSPMVISKGSNDMPPRKICRFLQCLLHGNKIISSFLNSKILNICPCCLGMLHYSLTGNDLRRLNNYSHDWTDCITNKPQHLD